MSLKITDAELIVNADLGWTGLSAASVLRSLAKAMTAVAEAMEATDEIQSIRSSLANLDGDLVGEWTIQSKTVRRKVGK